MTKLSVNINKIATIRNARGGNIPDIVKAAINCEKFGAQGITVPLVLMNVIFDTVMFMQ
jgi:pyridoxine 5-phosphate synthase